jgi:hypothetical protein
MRAIALLLPPRYQLFSEATPRKIVGTEGTIKVLLPEYQVYKCFIILNNCAIQNSKLGPFLMDSYFFLCKFYCNKNTISIVSFNLSEKYYSPVNSTNDYSPAGFLFFKNLFLYFYCNKIYIEKSMRSIIN